MEKEQIKDIADNLGFGMRCFIHSKSKEVKYIPDDTQYPGIHIADFNTDIKEIESNSSDYIEITGMDSRSSFRVMEDFISTVDSELIKEKLIRAIERPKPFRNFKFIIDNSGIYRENWFKFKDSQMIEWVQRQLAIKGL